MEDGILIYWTDGLNPPRTLDITEFEGFPAPPTAAPEDFGVSVEVLEEGPSSFFFWLGGVRATHFNLYLNDIRINTDPIPQEFYPYPGIAFTNYDEQHTAYVTGLVSDFEGDPSPEISFQVPVPVPQNLVVISGDTSASFSWDASAHAEGYNLYLNGVKHNTEPITDTEYEIDPLAPGAYDAYVRAIAEEKESAESNTEQFSIPLILVTQQEGDDTEAFGSAAEGQFEIISEMEGQTSITIEE